MLNKYITFLFLFAFNALSAQILEANSRPYRFDIDKYIYLEANSASYKFNVITALELLDLKMNEKLRSLNLTRENAAKSLSKDELNSLKEEVVQEVGNICINTRIPKFYFLPEELAFRLKISDFQDIKLNIPIEEIESFKLNFDVFTYTDGKYLFTEDEVFVIQEMKIHDPKSNRTYLYSNANLDAFVGNTFDFNFSKTD